MKIVEDSILQTGRHLSLQRQKRAERITEGDHRLHKI